MVSEEIVQKVLGEIQEEELVELAASLVRINSVWDPEAGSSEEEAARFVASWARQQGFQVLVEEAAPGRPNVIIEWEADPGSRRLMFEAHTDVVTPGDPLQWKHDPFGGEILEGRLYGRGANDTKGNLAAMLVAMAAIKKARPKLKGSILGGVLCDEEGLMLGVQDFIRRGHADKVTGAIICEPQDGYICPVQKGAVRAMFLVKGRMSHGAMPLSGLNPVPVLSRLIDGLWNMEEEAAQTHGKDPLLGWPSFTPTVVRAPARGPAQLSVVASKAELLVDIRTVPAQSHQKIVEALQELAAKAKEETLAAYTRLDSLLGVKRQLSLEVGMEVLSDRPCTHTSMEDPLVKSVEWATRTLTGKEPVYGGVPGATDGTFLWAWKGIPIVTIGAGDREVPHQVDEWVDLAQLFLTAKLYAVSALAYLSQEG